MKHLTKHELIKFTFIAILICSQFSLFAQHLNPAPKDDNQGSGNHFITNLESDLSMLVLAFGIITIFLEVYLIKTNKIDSNNAIKFVIVTLIITGTLFLITAGYDTQISPALGLLGTIAGYLLGKTENHERSNNQTP